MDAPRPIQPLTRPAGPVRRRLLFYVPGYDPRGAAYYHGLYAREAPKQGAISGMTFEISPRHRISSLVSRWIVKASEADVAVETQYDFLHWDDIVRETWARSLPAVIGQSLGAWWTIMRLGALKRLYKASWPFAITATWPVLFFAGAGLAALAVAGLVWALLDVWAGLHVAIVLPAALIAGAFAGRLVLVWAEKANGFWIGRLLSVMLAMGLGRLPSVEQRAAELARHIAERRAQEDCDEILVVAHSTGGDMAVRVLARLLEIDPGAFASGKLAFLSLGQMVICEAMPQGTPKFRNDLLAVATAPGLEWLDFGSPADPACIALADPLDTCEIARPADAPLRPKMLSPRFLKLFTPQTYAKLRKNKIEMHFMYLQAMEIAGDYDYFAITAGSHTLGARFAHLQGVRDFDRLQRGILRGRA
jgi:hypothetical protein